MLIFQDILFHHLQTTRFPGHESLKEHYAQKSTHKCEICMQEFCVALDLDAHQQQGCEGLIEIDLNADECKPTAIDCNSNDENVSNESDVEQLGDDLASKQKRKSVRRLKSPAKEHECDMCGRIFTKKSNLNRHHRLIHTHNPERDGKAQLVHRCAVCDRVCENELGLMLHRRTHADEHPFKCADCGRIFTKKSNLLRHCQLAHTDERPFQCKECGQSFKDKYVLANHRTRHTNDQPFECWLCHRM